MKVRSPVRNLNGVRQDLADWGTIEVECLKSLEKKGAAHSGEWQIFIRRRAEGGGEERSLLVAGPTIEPKVYQTTGGLMSLADKLGFTNPQIPLHKGEIGIWDYDQQKTETEFKIKQKRSRSAKP